VTRNNTWDSSARPDPDAESGVNSQGEVITPIESAMTAKDVKNIHRQADLSAEIIEERRKRAAEPVHMEGLQPLPSGARMGLPGAGQIPGGPDALDLAPSMRRSVPAPFSRERISVDHHGKSWGYVRAELVEQDDIVVDFGKVRDKAFVLSREDMAGYEDVATEATVLLTNITGHARKFGMADQLQVFKVHE
jgi:hypothetical protein